MAIVMGLDIHREQITFDALDTDTGETRRGRIHAQLVASRRPRHPGLLGTDQRSRLAKLESPEAARLQARTRRRSARAYVGPPGFRKEE